MKNRLIYSVLFLLIFITFSNGEEIKLEDGTVIKEEIKQFDGEKFRFSSGRAANLEEVKVITFGTEKDLIKSDDPVQNEDRKAKLNEYKKYFAKSKSILKKFPDAYGIIIMDRGENILRPDGSRRYKYYFVGYINKEKAKAWGQKSIWEQKERYTSKILFARTITPELKIFNYDPDSIEIVKSESKSWSYGDKDIMKVFSIPGVEVGNLIEYSYIYDTHNPTQRERFEPSFFFADDIPVGTSTFIVGLPKDKELNYETRNFPKNKSKPKTYTKDGVKYYKWDLRDIPPTIEEPYMPDSGDIIPRVDASIFKNWEYIFEFQRKMLLRKMKPTPAIEEKVKELTAGVTDVEAKIAKIYYFVQREIRYVSIKGSLGTGLTGHPASETFEKRYGDCVDKAVLLGTMLKVIGVDAYPVSINTNSSDIAPVKIPTIYANHAISEVHLNGKIFYLDATSTYYRYPYFRADDQGVPVVNEILGTILTIPVMPPEYNWNSYSIIMDLDENGDAVITSKNKYAGEYESGLKSYYSYYSTDEMRTKIFQRMVNDTSPGAEFEYYKMSKIDYETPFEMEYKYKVKEYPFIAGNLFIFNPRGRIHEFPEVVAKERRYPIEYTTSKRTDNYVEITIPKNIKVKYLPGQMRYKDKYIEFKGMFYLKDDKIIYEDTFKRFERIIPTGYYKKYRSTLLKIQEFSADNIILEKI